MRSSSSSPTKTASRPWRHLRIWLLGGLALLFLGLALLPATWLVPRLEAQCRGGCRLEDVQGLAWQGSAQVWVREQAGLTWVPLGRLAWGPDWGALGRGSLGLKLDLWGGHARVSVGLGGLELAADAIALPSGVVFSGLGQGLPKRGWGGWLRLADTHVHARLQDGGVQWSGQGQLFWREARTRLFPGMMLGNYQLTWQGDSAQGVQATLSTEEGGLNLQGRLQLEAARGYAGRFEGEARLMEARHDLESSLRLVARELPGEAGHFSLMVPVP